MTYKTTLLLTGILSFSIPAQAADLLSEPTSSTYLADSITGTHLVKLGDVSVTTPPTLINQWNNPLPLSTSANSPFPPGQDWTVKNATTSITFNHSVSYPGALFTQAYTLGQNSNVNGYLLPCGQEYDLFMGPTANQPLSNGTLTPKTFAQSAPIGSLKTLEFNFGLQIQSETIINRCSDDNYVGYSFNIILSSTTGKTIFWQLVLRDSRGYIQENNPCVGYPQGGSYCFTSTIDYVTFFTQQQQSVGPTVFYDVDVLPFIEAAIQQTSDPNLNHWSGTSAYWGAGGDGGFSDVALWFGPFIKSN